MVTTEVLSRITATLLTEPTILGLEKDDLKYYGFMNDILAALKKNFPEKNITEMQNILERNECHGEIKVHSDN